ncbi:MAG: SDR family NAD(P)-dependent oxidoreductase [Tabrizicola sp.]|nr:SDR family NAD(P)-dependent oxidoreductase [Tabrizicola sp.]
MLALGRLDGVRAIAPDTSLFLYMYVRKEALLSSQIEGTQSSLSDLLLYENNEAPGAPIDEIAVDDWLRLCRTNITGMFLVARAAFGLMRHQRPQGGRIINNGSISAHVPRPGSAPYTMSKHAVTGLTRTLGLDGRAFNIACAQIDIGNALTDMAARFTGGVAQADGSVRPEPVMDVAHVARMVLHMATLPLDVNTPFVTIMARDMPYIGRG